jgi:hypothetical protein
MIVLAAAIPLTLLTSLASTTAATRVADSDQDAPKAQTPPGRARIADSAQPGMVLGHIQQLLTRVTGIPEAPTNDVEALDRALLAAQAHRPAQPERVNELGAALAAALGHGVFDEVLMQRLSEDMYSALNNLTLTSDQAKLLAIDVTAVLQESGVRDTDGVEVMAALRRVCPNAIAPPRGTQDASQNGEPATPKRALQVLSRGSSD